MGEVKGVADDARGYARSAALDLLAYRRAFDHALAHAPVPYGLGVAWGTGLKPSVEAEISLCTRDTLADAIAALTAERSDTDDPDPA